MKRLARNLGSFILPITVLLIVPLLIEPDRTVENSLTFLVGLTVILVGLSILIATVAVFITVGNGTLAPWSPTTKLVTKGLYGYVRSPMIIGVLIVLIGESISMLSSHIFIWAILFFVINNIWFSVYEEPNLEKRFGNEYREYKKIVPKWIPRRRPIKSV